MKEHLKNPWIVLGLVEIVAVAIIIFWIVN